MSTRVLNSDGQQLHQCQPSLFKTIVDIGVVVDHHYLKLLLTLVELLTITV
jgi:hypothetical protein